MEYGKEQADKIMNIADNVIWCQLSRESDLVKK
jgi:hypothetical protein